MRKNIIIIVVLGIAALSGLQVYRRIAKSSKAPSRRQQQAVAVEIAPVEKKDILDIKEFTGSLAPQSMFLLAPKVPGRLEKLLVNMGDTVKKGQLVALIDSEEYRQAVEQSRAALDVAAANLAAAETALDLAKKEFERIKTLREKKIASESELDAAEAHYKTGETKYKVAAAQLEQAKSALKTAEIRLSYTRIKASWEGGSERRIIGEKYVDEGAMLAANTPIVSVLDINTLKAVINVTEEDYPKVNAGDSVMLATAAYPGRNFAGRVIRKSPALNDASRTVAVEAEVSNPAHLLKPGMFVIAEIELARRERVTAVPFEALTGREGKQGVFLLEEKDRKVRFVQVETGIITAESAEIINPPLKGHVVTLGQHLLADGTSVIIPKSDGGSEKRKNNRSDFHNEIKKPEGDRP